jgi:hypothetical protein
VQCNRATYASLMHTRTHPSFFQISIPFFTTSEN